MSALRSAESAAGQGSVLFIAAGSLGIVGQSVPGTSHSGGFLAVNALAIVLGVWIRWLPWDAWHPRATLVLVPAAFGLVVAGTWFDPEGIDTLYGLWYVVIFGWIGAWHPSRAALLMAPVGAVAYTIPFLPFSPSPSPESLSTVAIAIPISVVMAEVLAVRTASMRRANRALEVSTELLARANLTDDLTGVGNRRLANSLLDSMREGDGLVLLDLDHFKAVNDSLGHTEGDRALMELGTYLNEAIRDQDSVARFGGDEFMILVRDAGHDLEAIIERVLQGWHDRGSGVTLSAGAVVHHGRGPMETLKAVDALLYRAKAEGRDRLVTDVSPVAWTALTPPQAP